MVDEFSIYTEDDRDINFSLVKKSLPLALLATCKQIYSEASLHLEQKLEQLRSEPMRLVVDTQSFPVLFQPRGFFRPAMQLCLTRLQIGETGSLITNQEMEEIVRRHSSRRRSFVARSCKGLQNLETFRQLADFVQNCVLFMHDRTPASTIIALNRNDYRDEGIRDIVYALEITTGAGIRVLQPHDDYGSWNVFPGPVGFMLREFMCDQFDDPPSAECPDGICRTRIRKEANETAYGPARFYVEDVDVEDVDDEEWKRDWSE